MLHARYISGQDSTTQNSLSLSLFAALVAKTFLQLSLVRFVKLLRVAQRRRISWKWSNNRFITWYISLWCLCKRIIRRLMKKFLQLILKASLYAIFIFSWYWKIKNVHTHTRVCVFFIYSKFLIKRKKIYLIFENLILQIYSIINLFIKECWTYDKLLYLIFVSRFSHMQYNFYFDWRDFTWCIDIEFLSTFLYITDTSMYLN